MKYRNEKISHARLFCYFPMVSLFTLSGHDWFSLIKVLFFNLRLILNLWVNVLCFKHLLAPMIIFYLIVAIVHINLVVTKSETRSQITPSYPVGIYLLKVNNRNSRTKVWNMFKVNKNATKTTPFGVVLVALLLTLNIFLTSLL